MEFVHIDTGRERFMDLLLLGDENETLVRGYIYSGDMIAIHEGGLRGVCIVTDRGEGVYELKNLAVYPPFQRMGYGRALVQYALALYGGRGGRKMIVGTGDGTSNVSFYEKLGFRRSHIVRDFFTDNYPAPIVEDGVVLRDMLYLARPLNG